MNIFKKIIFFGTIFVVIYALCSMTNTADRDLWHRLAVGEIFWQTGRVLQHDIFAYTAVKSLWVDHEWGTGLVFYSLAHIFGDFGLIFLKILSFFAVLAAIYATNKLINPKDDNFHIGFYTVSTIAVISGFQNTVRSQIFTYIFFALWIYLLEKIKKNENATFKQNLNYIWIFPVTMLLWANMHGGFVAGFGLLGIYFLGELLNKNKSYIYLIIGAISLPVTLINPYGIKFWDYMITAVTMPRPYITEWKSLDLFGYFPDYIGFKLLLLITIAGWGYKILLNKKDINWTGLILLIVTLYLSLKHQRHVVFFAISASIFSYQYYYELINTLFKKYTEKFWNYFSVRNKKLVLFTVKSSIFIVLISLGTFIGLNNPLLIKVNETDYPTKAVEFLRINNIKGNLLVPFNWGSYALWKLYPQCKVSIDGRYEETYPDSTYMDITNFYFAHKNWDNSLEKYRNDIILMPIKSDIYPELVKLKDWKFIYKDKYAVILIPKSVKAKSWKMLDKNVDYSKTKFITNYRKF